MSMRVRRHVVLPAGLLSSCPSRRPLRENVRFYPTAEAAEHDGLRACKRCHPLDTERSHATAKVRELCRHIEAHPDDVNLTHNLARLLENPPPAVPVDVKDEPRTGSRLLWFAMGAVISGGAFLIAALLLR